MFKIVAIFLLTAVMAGGQFIAYGQDYSDDKLLEVCEGKVEEIDFAGHSLMVNSVLFFADSKTDVSREAGVIGTVEKMDFSDIRKGDYVKVVNYADSSGRLVADSIKVGEEEKLPRF